MIKQTKEDKVLQNSNNIIETFSSDKTPLELEYIEISKQYRKLLNRYNKIVKINDIMEKNVLNKNISLEDDKNTILKKSKTKILDTISSNRKLKEEHLEITSKDKQKIIELQKKLSLFEKNTSTVKEELTSTVSILQETKVKVKKLEEDNEKLSKEIITLKEIVTPFEEILEKELVNIRRNHDDFVLCIIGIDNFNILKNKLNEFTTVENFILGTLKYLKNSLKKSDTVIYFEAEMFYILMPNHTIEHAYDVCKMLGKRRTINQQNITLSAGITTLKDKDDTDSIIGRCLEAYSEAISDSLHSRVIKI